MQLRINLGQLCQCLCMLPIVLASAFPDQPSVGRMRHVYLVPQLTQQPAYLMRMHPGLRHDPAVRHRSESNLQGLGSGGPAFSCHLI